MRQHDVPQGFMPSVGLGTFQLQGRECEKAVRAALSHNYDLIDTAEVYDNQIDIGEVIGDHDRDSLFVTSKTWMNHYSHEGVLTSTDQTLQELRTGYLDLLLLHWPEAGTDYDAMLRGLKKLVDAGTVKNVGVSNFTVEHLKMILPKAERIGVNIAVNQVEFHPYLYQQDLLSFCNEHDIVLQGYAPIAKGSVADDDVLSSIGRNHGKTAVQVALRWALQKGVAVIPRSGDPTHIKENNDVFNFELSGEEMERIDALDEHTRLYNPPFAEF